MSRRPLQSADLDALSGCADGLARAFVTLSSDIAIVIDEAGIVTSVAQNETTPMNPAAAGWVGQPWVQTVTGETRRKIESLLADACTGKLGRRREVNHATTPGDELPVAYTALRLGEKGPVLAVGRDLRNVSAIQQRFLETQQSLERSYWRARHDEMRHRLLYQVATDAVITVEPSSLAVVALNPAAARLLQAEGGSALGRPLVPQFDARSGPVVATLLARARAGTEPVEGSARLAGSHINLSLVATRLVSTATQQVLLHLRQDDPPHDDPKATGSPLARHVDGTPEGIVVVNAAGQVREANLAFVQMVQAAGIEDLVGQPLETFLPGCGAALVDHVHSQGLVPRRRAVLIRRDTTALPVDMAGAMLPDVAAGDAGFTLRPCGTDALAADARAAALVKAVDALGAELGMRPLPELLLQAQALAQSHLVTTALDRHAGDVAAAARMLGIGTDQLLRLRRDAGLSPLPPR